MKKVSFALMAAGMVFLASCGGGADDKAKAAADSARVADSLAAIAAKEAAAADSAAQAAAEQARLDSIAAAEATAKTGKGSKGGKGGAAAPKKEEPKKTEPATNMKDAAKGGNGTGPKTMKDAATETKTSGGGAKSMKDMKGK